MTYRHKARGHCRQQDRVWARRWAQALASSPAPVHIHAAVVTRDEAGRHVATAPTVPGASARASTRGKALLRLVDAIAVVLGADPSTVAVMLPERGPDA